MENTLEHFKREDILYKTYDLKGSTVSREVKNTKDKGVLKDINYYRSNECFFFFDEDKRDKFLNQVRLDIGMLKNHNIMDYSLLVAVGVDKNSNEDEEGWRYMRDSANISNRIYSLALIDYLQEFNLTKYF